MNVVTALVLTFTLIDIHDPVVHGVLADLLRNAHYGTASTEEAAFLIRNSSGATFFMRWPPNGELNMATWSGPLPAGTVAILHTHPAYLPLPSNRDARVARATSIPVYVVTLNRIMRTDGGAPITVANGHWL
ncbi:MAG: hypothetical protein QOE82_3439 [Thermoanaerobaculia bacterium]|nr:hypothetical protein [Thermoanaerobaculia bacterium]